MVDELKSGAQLNSSRTAAAESATKIKDAGKDFTQLRGWR